jgi:hypothetical protein
MGISATSSAPAGSANSCTSESSRPLDQQLVVRSPNPLNAYSLNDITAQRGADGKITIQFGGCDAATANCLPITPGWNYLIRLYQPRDIILSGEWAFPEAQPIS